ncbi:MAG: glycosyl hydrolase [Gammaproteobacteria bacterium]|nr:MAG: glycosyl hydrolase [Gammaproteobacteria bacterium]
MARKSVRSTVLSGQRPKRAPSPSLAVLVATRKGAFVLRSDSTRRSWRLSKPIMLGHIVHHLLLDPRDGRSMLMAARTGHLGPTVFRSADAGRTWKEASRPPAFRQTGAGQKKHVVDHTFWLTPGHPSEPKVWYAGTSPQGLFRSEDSGDTWEPVAGLNDHPEYSQWMGWLENGTPDGPKLHSVLVDPRDAAHLYVAMSSGGVHESLDRGTTWTALVQGEEVVEQFDASRLDFHDPHCVRLSPANPDRLYQQNHCGIYRLDRPGVEWTRIGRSMPKSVGDIGFPMVVHPREVDTLWVFPMDGGGVWPRTSPGGRPAAYRSRNGGGSWQRQDRGLPRRDAWWTVKRQAMSADAADPLGLYFGTTSGELWASRNEGESWSCIARHLPEIYAVEAVELRR